MPSNVKPKWLTGDSSDVARTSKKHEERVASRLGAKKFPRSGGMRWSRWDKKTAQGDLGTKELHIEHKFVKPSTKSISLQRAWLEKVTRGANSSMKEPAMILTFEEPKEHAQDWILVPLSVWERVSSEE